MTRRLLLATALVVVAFDGPRLHACPACAGDPRQGTPWTLVGAFVLVPFGLAGVVGLAIRRELRARPR